MPFAMLIIGIVLLVAAVRSTQDDLFKLVKGDFIGQGNFVFWVVSILIIGAVGYIPKLRPISQGFLALVILVLFLAKGDPTKLGSGGFFEKFTAALNSTKTAQPSTAQSTATTQPATSNPLPTLPNLGGISV